jgi:DNA-binding CsgD family transcriptional regulator
VSSLPSVEQSQELLGAVYDAALDPQMWAQCLTELSATFGSSQSMILAIDRRASRSETLVTTGLDLGVVAGWKNCKEHVDVWYQRVFEVPEHSSYLSTELVSQRELRRSGFHADILRVLDIEFSLGGLVANNDADQCYVGVYRSARDGVFSDEQRALYSRLLPHFHRALLINRRLTSGRPTDSTVRQALDRCPYGVVVLERSGHAVLLNLQAEAILRLCDGLTLRHGRLKLADWSAQLSCDRLVHEATSGPRIDGEVTSNVMRAARPSGRRAYQLAIYSLSRNVDLDLPFGSGACLIFVFDPAAPRSLTLDGLVSLYGLTRAEARLCAVLFESEGLREAIAALRIKRNTAKTQMRSIFAKVGVSSQVQLMRFLALGLALGDRAERRH